MTDCPKQEHKQVKILIVEDFPLSRKGLKIYLNDGDGHTVTAEANSGEEGLRLARMHRPDLIITDIGLPGMNGLEFSRRVMALLPDARVLLFSVYSDKEIVKEAICMGVSGFLLKEDAEQLHDAMKKVMQGERYLSPSLSGVVTDIIMSTGSPVLKAKELEKLSLREVQVLSMTVAGESQAAIAKKLFISSETVKTHRMRIKRKLGLKNFSDIRKSALDSYLKLPQQKLFPRVR